VWKGTNGYVSLRVPLFEGDSGSPIVITDQHELASIFSRVPDQCGLPGYPAVYNNDSAMWWWITNYCNLQKIPMEITKAGALF
jgi:secreted trypsin-like serine protease